MEALLHNFYQRIISSIRLIPPIMTHKILLFFFSFLAFSLFAAAQCQPTAITFEQYNLVYVNSEDGTSTAANVIDGNVETLFRTLGNTPFPHELQIDLGAIYSITQLVLTPPQDNQNGKLATYEVYVSMDGADWGEAQASGLILYDGFADTAEKWIDFGAVDGQYVRLVGLSNFDVSNPYRWLLSELSIGENPCGSSGKLNQTIDFDLISKKKTSDAPFAPPAMVSSDLPMIFEVVSGPAMIENGLVYFEGTEGTVVLKAIQGGNDNYYPVERVQTFEVIDPANYVPAITSRLSEAHPIEMHFLSHYPIYATASIEHSDLFDIQNIVFEVDGTTYEGTEENGLYTHWWKPNEMGNHEVNITAYSSNGQSSTKTVNVEVAFATGNRQNRTLEEDLILFGGENSRWLYSTYELPQFVGTYEPIMAEFWVTCPDIEGACDDWDRKAFVEVKAPDGTWVEIIRYITPYGVACDHSIDLTDYASLLQGQVEMRVFIDTWGTGGWNVNLRFDYDLGLAEYPYTKISPLWRGTFDFGNYNNLQPMGTVSHDFADHVELAKLKLVTTGHGWGNANTGNAAEFYPAIHHLNVNDSHSFEQDLLIDCSPNPDGCQPQAGTYTLSRAGWCPGMIAPVFEYDFTPFIADGKVDVQYLFEEGYVDLCHPNHPDCVSGVTCANCDEGYNPHYEIAGNLITYSKSPFLVTDIETPLIPELEMAIRPNPSSDFFEVALPKSYQGKVELQLQSLDGRLLQSHQFENTNLLEAQRFDVSDLPQGLYVLRLVVGDVVGVTKMVRE